MGWTWVPDAIAHTGDPVFDLDALGPEWTRHEMPDDCVLVTRLSPDYTSWMEFALFAFFMGPALGTGEPTHHVRIFHGEGSLMLGEIRHTYWGEADNAGYINYPSVHAIVAALTKLREIFDEGERKNLATG